MNRFLFCFIFLNPIFLPGITLAQGNAIFPDEDQLQNLQLVVADPDNSTFVLMNRARKEQKGSLGDFVGSEQWEVYKITYDHIKLKTLLHLIGRDGQPFEQPTGNRIGLSWSGSKCYRDALPWLHGGWELTYDPDNSEKDLIFFNNQTCQFGLVTFKGRSIFPNYSVNYNYRKQDGTFTISIPVGNTKRIMLTTSADRSRIYHDSGAYYTKITDDFGKFDDRSFNPQP